MRRFRGRVGCLAVVLAAMGGCSDSGQEAARTAPVTPESRRSALAVGTPRLVRDIQPTPPPSAEEGSHPSSFVSVGSTRFFVAYDALHGVELWKSDGTPAGTVLVKDLEPGPLNGGISELTAAHGVLYFVVSGSFSGSQLWRSDGTAEGTRPVFTGSPFGPAIQELEAANGTLFLTAADSGGGLHLWSSDGSREGTRLLKAFPTTAGSEPRALRDLGGRLYFSADDGVHGRELWTSDGTSEGTVLVKDLAPGVASTTLGSLAGAGDVLYFTAGDYRTGFTLWKSDGSSAGTVPLSNLPGGPVLSEGPTLGGLGWLAVSGGTLYFSANDGTSGAELWKSDGTPKGTVRVKDIHPLGDSSPTYPRDVNGVLFFLASHPDTGREVWTSDGTAEGTVCLSDLQPGAGSGAVNGPFAVAGSRAYFFADSGKGRPSLWTSDGTLAGTRELRELSPTSAGLSESVGAAEGSLLLAADDGVHGVELWKTEGTPEGTVLLRDLHRGTHGSTPQSMMELGDGRMLFAVFADGGPDLELWASDGSEAGTRRVLPGVKSLGILSRRVGGVRYFTASTTKEGAAHTLWRSDGTPEGTSVVRDFPEGMSVVEAELGGRVFFSATTSTEGAELWASDGTPEGTVRVKDIRPGTASSRPRGMINVGGTLYFTADDGVHGPELWKSDGTEAGTVMVKDLLPGGAGAAPLDLENLNGTLVFSASEDALTGKLGMWRLGPDGQPRRIPLSAPGVTPGEPERLRIVNGTLLVFAGTLARPQLWSYDGTSEHATLLFSDQIFYLADLVAAGRVLYFLGGNGLGSEELWRSDGTLAGTYKVADADQGFFGSRYSYPSFMLGLEDRAQVLLRSAEGAAGAEPWVSDGSAVGTALVADLSPGASTSYPHSLTRSGDHVFFSADDGVHGAELWRLTLPPRPPDTTLPVLVCPASVTVEPTSSTGAIASWPGARVSDDVSASIPLTYSHVPGREFPVGTTVVTVRAKDAAGNEALCAFEVRVRDSIAPTVSCPADLEVEATGSGTPVSFAEATASDGMTARPEVTYSHAPGSAFPVGTTAVTATARDEAGNEATCSFRVTVKDTVKPALTCPEALTAEAASATGARVTYAATASDTVSPVSVAYEPASGSELGLGITVVRVTAKDGAGNEATCSFSVTVRDGTAPSLTCPAAVRVEATGASGAPVTFAAAHATDAVTASPEVTYSQASGNTFPVGETAVTVTAKDGAGNEATCSFSVTVRDGTAPALTCPAAVLVEATGASGAPVTFAAAHATDAVTVSPEVTYSQGSGSTFPVGETAVTVTARDAADNASSCSFSVVVRDTTAPTVSCPADVAVVAREPAGSTVQYPAATVHDAVTAEPRVLYSHAPGSAFPVGTTPVTATVEDAAGNTASCSFHVTVSAVSVRDEGSGCAASGGSPAGLLGLLLLLAWPSLGRARTRRS
ncbi:ELWxxDGT repeat protein [Archangium gephyra]|uniref:ELWxxDGT repeat protein n=1 Tax=Archangium gephyra TaxID=48 RepID=A0AAC8TAX4_9BACT|nr:ELWxxDGT repeat protein [Archangium gephyra]AKI99369.1 Flagellar hook-length control protein FliK [Archangium gephyra]REG28084.1 ELWxxDGT repeat protein [Archangium gephyra]